MELTQELPLVGGMMNFHKPTLAPLEVIIEFTDDADAIEYSILYALRNDRSLTQRRLADQMGVNRAVVSKMRQGQVNPPINRIQKMMRTCGTLAFAQWLAFREGYVMRKKEDIEAMEAEIERLKSEAEHYRRRAIGE